MFYKINVKTHNGNNYDSFTEYIAAYSFDQAKAFIEARLKKAGWTVDGILGNRISITDLRDSCDHTTDE